VSAIFTSCNDKADGTYTCRFDCVLKDLAGQLRYWMHERNIQTCRTLTDWLAYSMEQSPSSETNWFSGSQETPHVLWNPMFHYRIHKCPSPVPILNQLDPVHTTSSHFMKNHLNIILPSTSGSPKWSCRIHMFYIRCVEATVVLMKFLVECVKHTCWYSEGPGTKPKPHAGCTDWSSPWFCSVSPSEQCVNEKFQWKFFYITYHNYFNQFL